MRTISLRCVQIWASHQPLTVFPGIWNRLISIVPCLNASFVTVRNKEWTFGGLTGSKTLPVTIFRGSVKHFGVIMCSSTTCGLTAQTVGLLSFTVGVDWAVTAIPLDFRAILMEPLDLWPSSHTSRQQLLMCVLAIGGTT